MEAVLFLCENMGEVMEMSVWQYYQPNPLGKSVGDCSVRAVSMALRSGWYEAFDEITKEARRQADVISSDAVWGAVLKHHGFSRAVVPNSCPDCYTAKDFCIDRPYGTYVLAFGGHVATVRDGILYDSWDSSEQVPQYYWFRR